MQEYLTARETARELAVPYDTLMGWIYRSKIRAERRGRFWFLHVDVVAAKKVELNARRSEPLL